MQELEVKICRGCHQVLTEIEEEYYSDRCEQCVIEDHERLQRWRAGEDDPELDEMYSIPKPTKH